MKIVESIYQELLYKTEPAIPEHGGILGCKNSIIITVHHDKGIQTDSGSYQPDIAALNRIISIWQQKGIQFGGMFHTHFITWDALSEADKEFITIIMKAMPDSLKNLYFPLVFPNNKIIPFLASRKKDGISITKDIINIIDEKELIR